MVSKTIGKLIVEHMESEFVKKGTYKFSSKMIVEFIQKVRPGTNKNHIASEIAVLKKNKAITNIDEKVPDQRGAVYFALISVLDAVTNPSTPSNVNTKTEEDKSVSIPVPKPSEVDSNPLNKINARIDEIFSVIKNLDSYCTENLTTQKNIRIAMEVFASYEAPKNTEILNAIKEVRQSNVTQNDLVWDMSSLADSINARLGDLTQKDSFVYRVREEIHTELHASKLVNSLNISEQSDEYKRGLKDGIRLAIEMGLAITRD